MRKILTASIFVLTFCAFAFGQDSNCPTISVNGPSTAIELEEPMTFTANVSGIDLTKIEYEWFVESGVIVEGQGTKTIKVVTDKLDSTPTALVKIKGLHADCPNTDSETAIIIDPPPPILLDEFKISSQPIDSKRLDDFVSEIENNPRDKGYIIIYSNKNFPLSEIKRKESFIKNYLVKKKIAEDRITIIIDRSSENIDENRIRLWRVPPGVELPIP